MVVRVGRARGHGKGRPVANMEVSGEMRELHERMADMELGRQRDPEAGTVSEAKEEGEEEAPMQETPELR